MALNFGQNLFPVTARRVIQSYNYLDLAEGTGVVRYQLFATKDSAATEFIIIPDSQTADIITKDGSSTGTTASSTFVQVIDQDFDMSAYNFPRNVRGKVYLQFRHSLDGAGATSCEGYSIIKIMNGATELGSVQTSTIILTEAGPLAEDEMCMIELSEKHFKKGENLTVTIESWAKAIGGGTATMLVYHNLVTEGQEFFIWIPYKIR